ncbi:hypothetical protein GJ496_011028 [Pomphorhynchus laevis]|nr:hypothetical protein GJ496_011028 [Pomphorhynchus laevis]
MRYINEHIGGQISDLHDTLSSKYRRNGEELDPGDLQTIPKRSLEMMRKKFVARKSLLSDLFEIRHINTIRHVFIAVLIIFAMEQMARDISDGDSYVLIPLYLSPYIKIYSIITMHF